MTAGRATKRAGQLALLLAAGALWGGSRLVWVDVMSASGLGQPRTTHLTGGTWSTALVPLALLLLAATLATIVARGWQQRALAVLAATASAIVGYLAISLWAVRDVSVRAARLAEVPVTDLVGAQRHYVGAALVLVAAVLTLVAAVLLVRSPAVAREATDKYDAPARRREAAREAELGDDASERMMWDALDEGRDPTTPDKGR